MLCTKKKIKEGLELAEQNGQVGRDPACCHDIRWLYVIINNWTKRKGFIFVVWGVWMVWVSCSCAS